MEFIDTIHIMLLSFVDFLRNNKDTIVTVMSTIDVGVLIGGVVALIKTIIAVKSNTTATNGLRESNDNLQSIVNVLTDMNVTLIECQKGLADVMATINSDDNDIKNKCNDIRNKLNSIVEAQTLVYSTIKDENIRRAVQGHLVAAKYSEPNVKEKLDAQVEELQSKLNQVVEEIKAVGIDTADAIRHVSATDPAESESSSNDFVDVTRGY